jgi:hypothetical protein
MKLRVICKHRHSALLISLYITFYFILFLFSLILKRKVFDWLRIQHNLTGSSKPIYFCLRLEQLLPRLPHRKEWSITDIERGSQTLGIYSESTSDLTGR